MKSREAQWANVASVVMVLGYVLARYVFFSLHGMKDLPLLLLVAGCAVALVSALCKARWPGAGAAAGYVLGFVLAAAFHTQGTDPGGGATDNFPLIWACVMLAAAAAGVVAEVVTRRRSRK